MNTNTAQTNTSNQIDFSDLRQLLVVFGEAVDGVQHRTTNTHIRKRTFFIVIMRT
jgi:hypothetical protein